MEGWVTRNDAGHLIYEDWDADWRIAMVPLTGGRWLHTMYDAVCEFRGGQRAEVLACRSPVQERREANSYEIRRVP